ncbi:hypothetical protein G7Z17_g1280 [Cylindrodendrum hubeiense]|uniref:Multicopper oxidase n=1 Tax=Cylindrodendrum hubeiense TaxID=595255 RepID=A0A9P5LK95_9HYPO|nr:hypothetical protein G7Z17_g1280 [Cylindrodendrum hubeiense]
MERREARAEATPMFSVGKWSDTDAEDEHRHSGSRSVFLAILTFGCVCTVALAGFNFVQFSHQQQFPFVHDGHGAVTIGGSTTASPPASTGDSSHDYWAGDEASLELDLKTDFIISSKPTTRSYTFNVTRELFSPDGLQKSMILVNGRSPGPLIEANTGDTIKVIVNNMMPDEKTTIHWHGIDQRNSVWMDGVHGVTQCGIPPGESFTYEFTVSDQRGTFWYHAHVSVQYTDGLYGPLIVHDSDDKVPPVDDDKIIMIGDLYHRYGEELVTDYLGSSPAWSPGGAGMEPPPDNIIINGQHIFNCSTLLSQHDGVMARAQVSSQPSTNCTGGSLYSTRVKSGSSLRLRIISHSTFMPYWFNIDNHVLQIVEIDGVEVEPIKTTRVFMNPGQRYSVLVDANQTAGNYLIRATAARSCFHLMNHDPNSGMASINFEATGLMSYDDNDPAAEAIGKPWDIDVDSTPGVGKEPWDSRCHDLPFDLPKPVRKLDAYDVGERNHHYFKFRLTMDGDVVRTFVNGTKYTPLSDDATLWTVPQRNLSSQDSNSENIEKWDSGPSQRVLVSRDASKGAQIVINSEHMMIHPWHLHGKLLVCIVGWGDGSYGDGETTWNLENPMRRDTVTMPGSSHIIIRILADNPGIWALHCHILWHAEGGMFIMTEILPRD